MAERYILPNLPSPETVLAFHTVLTEYVNGPDPLFLLRAVSGTERRQIYSGRDGARFKATDNAPAWAIHATLAQGHRFDAPTFAGDVASMPAHLFDAGSIAAPTANAAGWHVAHIFDVKDGNTDYARWSRREMVGRFVRNVHPCNYFLLPKPEWQRWGGDRRVIGFFAELYQRMYAEVWQEFASLAQASGAALERVTGPIAYRFDVVATPGPAPLEAAGRQPSELVPRPMRPVLEGVIAQYSSSRLTFKRDIIEPLGDDGAFRVTTPVGIFEMTKSDFYRAFPGVPRSRSYRINGYYNYPTPPRVAEEFRVEQRSDEF